MNRFDTHITAYLYENKEVALEKIGTIKTTAFSSQDTQATSIEFIFDRKVSTSPELAEYIAAKENKNRHLIASDLESYLAQVREFINIGKSYEILHTGFIKANRAGVYEFIPYSEANKPIKAGIQPDKPQGRSNNRAIIQLITLLIVIAVLAGLGWQAYQFYSQSKTKAPSEAITNISDTIENTVVQDTNTAAGNADTGTIAPPQTGTVTASDSLNMRYIFETTASIVRAKTRTAQLKTFGNDAGYDSFMRNQTKFYNLYILNRTKVSDTLAVKDSLSRFLQKDIKLEIEPAHP